MAEAYRISALKYRPALFGDVVAQEHITRTLRHGLEKQQIANAYIFAGPRGTGKTTTARIFAKALNCTDPQNQEPCNECSNCQSIIQGLHPDVMEIDAASNRQVEEAEALRETTQFAPALGKYKIYIIDECHMLTTHANNALLKTLEEPPSHVKFIFATTELNKILPTIKSRCQLFQFRRIPAGVIVEQLKMVLQNEASFAVEDPSELDRILYLIAQSSEGGMRDALVSLDQLMAFCSGALNLSQVEEMMGVVEFEHLHRFIGAVIHHELDVILHILEDISNRGRELKWFLHECQQYLRNLMVLCISSQNTDLVDLPEDYIRQMQTLAKQTQVEQILYISDQLWEAERRMYFSPEARMIIEVAAVKASKAGQAVGIKDLLKQLTESGGVSIHQTPQLASPTQPDPSSYTLHPTPEPPPRPKASTPNTPSPQTEAAAVHTEEDPLPEPPPEKKPIDDSLSEPPKPEPSPAASTVSDQSIEKAGDCSLSPEQWASLLEELEEKNTVFSHCLDKSVITGYQNGTLIIRVNAPDKFHLNTLEKTGNRKMLEELIASYCGKPVQIKFEIKITNQPAPASSAPESKENSVSRGELMERLEQSESFQDLQKIFPGKIIQIRPFPTPH